MAWTSDNDASLQAPRHRCIKPLPVEQCLETGLLLVSRVQCCPWVVVTEVVEEVVEEIVEDPWSTKPPKSKRVGLWKERSVFHWPFSLSGLAFSYSYCSFRGLCLLLVLVSCWPHTSPLSEMKKPHAQSLKAGSGAFHAFAVPVVRFCPFCQRHSNRVG